MPPLRPQTKDLVIGNDVNELAIVTEALESFGARHGIPRKPLTELQVALDEMISNVIKYAWPGGGAHEVRIRITAWEEEVQVEIVDDGEVFDPRSVPEPEAPLPGHRPRPGGVGIHMVRQLVDGCDYARVDGCNHLVLTKRCTSEAP
jgi:anti-sigma regulatory factor (Ser/Thr protein kinase)